MGERKVKGSILLDYIRMIKANRDKDWNKYLKPEDWEIVNGRVLPSVWYPLETFQRCGLATFHVLGGGKLENVRAWGKISMSQLVGNIYKSMIADADPLKAVERFSIMRSQFFNFSSFELQKMAEKHVKVSFTYDVNDKEGTEAYSAQLQGMIEQLLILAGAKNPKVDLNMREWKGDPVTEFDVKWE